MLLILTIPFFFFCPLCSRLALHSCLRCFTCFLLGMMAQQQWNSSHVTAFSLQINVGIATTSCAHNQLVYQLTFVFLAYWGYVALKQLIGHLQHENGGFNMRSFVDRGINTQRMEYGGIAYLLSRHPQNKQHYQSNSARWPCTVSTTNRWHWNSGSCSINIADMGTNVPYYRSEIADFRTDVQHYQDKLTDFCCFNSISVESLSLTSSHLPCR